MQNPKRVIGEKKSDEALNVSEVQKLKALNAIFSKYTSIKLRNEHALQSIQIKARIFSPSEISFEDKNKKIILSGDLIKIMIVSALTMSSSKIIKNCLNKITDTLKFLES